jgi:short-subunit dehydrogenase
MKRRTWAIIGASSIIAESFAQLVAEKGHSLLLIGRDQAQLAIIAADIEIRYSVLCEVMIADFTQPIAPLIKLIDHHKNVDLFIAHSCMLNNHELNHHQIHELLTINVVHTTQLIHAYLQKKQSTHRLIFISSVAASRGRAKNSLYGASKAAIEIYLEGLQQNAPKNQQITIARLGFIDTHTTYGEPGIFYAAPPKTCAKACLKALESGRSRIYYPFFWRYIMMVFKALPLLIYQKMGKF